MNRKDTFEPAAGLVEIITRIVDDVLKQRRMHPLPPLRGMSQKQFAIAYGMGLSTVSKEIREGRLEAFEVGKRVVITPAAADKWEASRPRVKAGDAVPNELSPPRRARSKHQELAETLT